MRLAETCRLVYRFIRTVAGFAGLLAGAAVGVIVRLPTRDRRTMADGLLVCASTAALWGSGVRVRVVGAEHARAPRPAVFLFNHQSQFDVIALPYVLRTAVTGIAKAEIIRNPVFGPLMRFAGVTFIDRSDTTQAVKALQPVVDTLKSGVSVAIAPEGHRSPTPTPLPFKKGAFHLAIRAGVPIIPVVLRNSGEIQHRDGLIVTPGILDVAVLEPIDVSEWNPEAMDNDIEQVRQLFIDTLTNWPSTGC